MASLHNTVSIYIPVFFCDKKAHWLIMVCFRFALGAKHKENNTVKLKATRLFLELGPQERGDSLWWAVGGEGGEGST